MAITTKKASGVQVIFCSCTNDFQDKKYGKNQRLHNVTNNSGHKWRCTVCGSTKS